MTTVTNYFPLGPLYNLAEDLENIAVITCHTNKHKNKRFLRERISYIRKEYAYYIDILPYELGVPMDAILEAYWLITDSADEEDLETIS